MKATKWPEEKLRAIDPDCIPDDLLRQWWARRNAAKAAANRTRTDVDERTRRRLDRVKEAMRLYRLRQKQP